MKVTIESTAEIVHVDGILVRVWKGTTESGIPVTVLVNKVTVETPEHAEQIHRELMRAAHISSFL